MKKVILLLTAVIIAVGTFANNGIILPREFFNCKLGVSTKAEVLKNMRIVGAKEVVVDSTSASFNYEGWHEGMNYNGVLALFRNDTLSGFSYLKTCLEPCEGNINALVENLKKKYANLPIKGNPRIEGSEASRFFDSYNCVWGGLDYFTSVSVRSELFGFTCTYVDIAPALGKDFLNDIAEENKVYGVAGVKFGNSRETVQKTISSKASQLLESDAHSLNYYKVKIGGMTYDYATFYFAQGKGLVSVNLQSSFHSWREEEALMAFENVKSQYSRKYSNFKVLKDEKDEKVYSCGAFIDGYDYKPILITFQKSLSRGGEIMYYVQVDYYHARRNGMYDDEI